MILSLIAALDQNRGIGYQGKIPWRLPSDLRRFKQITWGHHLIMGRKTYASIGRPLPGRIMIVLSRTAQKLPTGCTWAKSLPDAVVYASQANETEAFVIGGGEIYAQAIGLAQRLYLTEIQATFPCDVWFPEYANSGWNEVFREEVPKGDVELYDSTFRVLKMPVSSFK